eukprot:scaffold52521_cov36-Phaeocystis_antarctica.AAC.1
MGGEDGGLGGGGLGGGGALSEGGDGGEQRVGHCVLQSRCPGCLNSKCFVSSKLFVGHCIHAPLHRQRLVVAFEWKVFFVESGGGAVDVAGAGG